MTIEVVQSNGGVGELVRMGVAELSASSATRKAAGLEAVPMNKTDRCFQRNGNSKSACRPIKDVQTVQPFPSSGLLAKNLGLPLAVLHSRIDRDRGRTYSYVLSTVGLCKL